MDVDKARVGIVLTDIARNCQISIDKVLDNLNLALSSLQVTYLSLSVTIYFADGAHPYGCVTKMELCGQTGQPMVKQASKHVGKWSIIRLV